MEVVELRQTKTESGFGEFWEACPKRVGKVLAKAKWDAIVSEHGLTTRMLDKDSGLYVEAHLQDTPERIVEGMKAYADSLWGWQNYQPIRIVEDRYVLHPATFLNRGRWLDYV